MKYITTPEFEDINSQTCEQIFSSLRRIATQIAYMYRKYILQHKAFSSLPEQKQYIENKMIAISIIDCV